jgi:hypothetical protein
MSYNFKPKTEEELGQFNLLPEGIYPFEVIKATRKKSKSGNDMAELVIMIWDKEALTYTLFDYLVFSDVNMCLKKVSHFCKATGLQDEYEKGCLREELERLSGKLKLGIQDARPNENGGFYPKRNVVEDYLTLEEVEKSLPKNDDFSDKDIPF